MRPETEIAGIIAGQAALNKTLDQLSAADLVKASLLPDWSVAHVLAHVARNADSVVRRLQGAIDDEVVDQYAGGKAGRAAEIEESAGLPPIELIAQVRSSSADVERLCAAMPDDAWERLSRAVNGSERPARDVVYSRWREVEIHHVDLGLDHYTAADWPEELVQRMLPEVLDKLAPRTDPRTLLAWTIGRGNAPVLESWG
ncbi:MAG: maleylpyruvate isomerase N-terminal domain-containing protein [Actinomycetota bacterium]